MSELLTAYELMSVQHLREWVRVGEGDDSSGVTGITKLITAAEENERLRAALEFYADAENWTSKRVVCCEGDGLKITRPIALDDGEKARAALERAGVVE